MSKFLLRPHHMLCLQFFEGKGYSDAFVDNMMKVKNKLEQKNPQVHIIESTDDICADCPHRRGKKCKDEEYVKGYDERVYEQVIHEVGNQTTWNKISEAIKKNIIDAGKMKQVCRDCQWSEICFK